MGISFALLADYQRDMGRPSAVNIYDVNRRNILLICLANSVSI